MGRELVPVTFHMQHSGGAGGHARNRGGLVSIRIGRHARQRGEEGEDSNQTPFVIATRRQSGRRRLDTIIERDRASERAVRRQQPSQSAAVWRRVHTAAGGSWGRRAEAERLEKIPRGDSDQMHHVKHTMLQKTTTLWFRLVELTTKVVQSLEA